MTPRRLWLAPTLIAALWLPACDDAPLGPSQVTSDSLRVVATVNPTFVSAGDSLRIGAVFHNALDRPMTLRFGMGCPFFLEVVAESTDTRVPLLGTGYPSTVGSSLTIPARDSLVALRDVSVRIDGSRVPPGRYLARLDFTNGLWALEAPFTVRD